METPTQTHNGIATTIHHLIHTREPCALLSLPVELLLEILTPLLHVKSHLEVGWVLRYLSGDARPLDKNFSPGILLTCKTLRSIGLPLFYNVNTFLSFLDQYSKQWAKRTILKSTRTSHMSWPGDKPSLLSVLSLPRCQPESPVWPHLRYLRIEVLQPDVLAGAGDFLHPWLRNIASTLEALERVTTAENGIRNLETAEIYLPHTLPKQNYTLALDCQAQERYVVWAPLDPEFFQNPETVAYPMRDLITNHMRSYRIRAKRFLIVWREGKDGFNQWEGVIGDAIESKVVLVQH